MYIIHISPSLNFTMNTYFRNKFKPFPKVGVWSSVHMVVVTILTLVSIYPLYIPITHIHLFIVMTLFCTYLGRDCIWPASCEKGLSDICKVWPRRCLSHRERSQEITWETVWLVTAIAIRPKREKCMLALLSANQNAAAGLRIIRGSVRINSRACFGQSG